MFRDGLRIDSISLSVRADELDVNNSKIVFHVSDQPERHAKVAGAMQCSQ